MYIRFLNNSLNWLHCNLLVMLVLHSCHSERYIEDWAGTAHTRQDVYLSLKLNDLG